MSVRAPRTRGSIVKTGPFFERNPAATFAENARDMMRAVAIEGELDAKARIASIPPAGVRTGQTRRKLRGRVRSLSGREWRATAIVGIPRDVAGGIAAYAALARIERLYGPMRGTTSALRSSRAVNVAELTKGL